MLRGEAPQALRRAGKKGAEFVGEGGRGGVVVGYSFTALQAFGG